jgi:tRNA G18 (ribose-2'-O)-methylase SpoU
VILYGRNPVREALRAGRRQIDQVWATERTAAREPWLRSAHARIASAEEIERRSGSPDHQGVCADAGGYPYVSAPELLAVDDPFIVALDELQDPQNLGAIARSAECAGTTGLIICERRGRRSHVRDLAAPTSRLTRLHNQDYCAPHQGEPEVEHRKRLSAVGALGGDRR